MSSPFSLYNTPLSGPGNASGLQSSSDSDPESDVVESPDRCAPSSEADLSAGWMFSGSYSIDRADLSSSPKFDTTILSNLFEERARIAPVKLEHMIIFANKIFDVKNRLPAVSIRGYIHGKRTSMSVWQAWLGQDILWTACSGVGRSDEYNEDIIRSEDPDSPWFVLGKYGVRKRFDVQGRTFYFEASLEIDVQDSSRSEDGEASYILQLVKEKFMDIVELNKNNDFQRNGARYVLVQCDTRQLAHASAGSTLTVFIQGFVQCMQNNKLRKWQNWLSAHWDTVPGGLCGFQMYEDAISESSTWTTIFEFGVLVNNNSGRKAAAQASGVRLRSPKYSFVRDQYCTVAAVKQFSCSYINYSIGFV
jgi:hypothetical protein